MPDLGDEVAGLLDPLDDVEVRRWTRQTGVALRYGGWQDRGNTTARLIAAYAGRRSEQKLIMKYVPMGRRETAESALHADAWAESPTDFRDRHLVKQPWAPIMLPRGGWILFQEIAGGDLTTVRSMSARLGDAIANTSSVADLAKSAGAAVAAAIGDWNGDACEPEFPTTAEHLQLLLGKRMENGQPLHDWAHTRGLLAGSPSRPTATTVGDLPNPLMLAMGPHPAANRRVYVFQGRAHGDLHPGNILLGSRPDQFWFIDLARYGSRRPLTFDPVYLLLTTTAHFLPSFKDEGRRSAAIDFLLDPWEAEKSWLPEPFCELITAVHSSARARAAQNGLTEEWRTGTLLSFSAGALIMCGRGAFSAEDREWFLRVSAAASSRYAALRGVALPRDDVPVVVQPQPSHRPAVGDRRVLAVDRASLTPRTLPVVSRARLLDLALDRRRQHSETSGGRQVLALTGDGGIGKSVLLGQLLDRLEADVDQAVVLVACGSVESNATLVDLAAVDAALGAAADPVLGKYGLLGLLETLRSAHGAVTVLVDTLDLVLSEASAVGVAALLAEALRHGEVVVTCRALEFNDHLHAIARLSGRLTTFPMPVLDESEIILWAERYLQSNDASDRSDFITSLAGGISAGGSLKQICSLPVRLALACQTFADEGHVPEDLTVTGLYQAYWEARVRRHAGQVGAVGEAMQSAALHVARHVITPSGRIAVRVPKAAVPVEHLDGLKGLASEGVLRELPVDWEFFHQTFAEFALGRWVLSHGVESFELTDLIERATTGRANIWPVISSVLLQVSDYDDYRAVAAMVPAASADATRTRVLGALQRPETDALAVVLNDLAESPDLLPVALADLGHAPERHLPEAFDQVLKVLRRYPESLASDALDALVLLVQRKAAGGALLRKAIEDVASLREPSDEKRTGYLQRLVEPFVTRPPSAEKLSVLRDVYPSLGPLGMRDAIRAHVRHAQGETALISVTRIALERKCPLLGDEELVDLLLVPWNNAAERKRLKWTSWREVLAANLPQGWDNAQIKLVVRLAVEDEVLAAELTDELLRGSLSQYQRHVNAFAQIAASRVEWTASRLLSQPVPKIPVALNAISMCGPAFAQNLDRTIRFALIEWLRPGRATAPRAVWPTQFILAGDDLDVLSGLFGELAVSEVVPAVLFGVAQAVSQHASLSTLDRHAADVRALLDRVALVRKVQPGKILQIRARLEGRLAEIDEQARAWMDHQIVTGASPAVAGTVIKTIADAHSDGLSALTVSWLAELLRTPHTDAAERLATMLRTASTLSEEVSPEVVIGVVNAVVARMRAALERQESSGLHRALLDLLIYVDKVHPTGEAFVWEVYRIIRSRLGSTTKTPPSYYPAAIRDLAALSGTLMSVRLDAGTVRGMLGDLLLEFDPTRSGTKIGMAVASLLFSVTQRDPDAPEWLVGLFEADRVALVIRMAIAEALLKLEGEQPGGRAAALKDSSHCPPEVAALIVTRLRT